MRTGWYFFIRTSTDALIDFVYQQTLFLAEEFLLSL